MRPLSLEAPGSTARRLAVVVARVDSASSASSQDVDSTTTFDDAKGSGRNVSCSSGSRRRGLADDVMVPTIGTAAAASVTDACGLADPKPNGERTSPGSAHTSAKACAPKTQRSCG